MPGARLRRDRPGLRADPGRGGRSPSHRGARGAHPSLHLRGEPGPARLPDPAGEVRLAHHPAAGDPRALGRPRESRRGALHDRGHLEERRARTSSFRGETYYWSKHMNFLRVVDLPSRTRQPLELALEVEDDATRDLLARNGWLITGRLRRPPATSPPTSATSSAPEASSRCPRTSWPGRGAAGSATAASATWPRVSRSSLRTPPSASSCPPARGCSPSRPSRRPRRRSTRSIATTRGTAGPRAGSPQEYFARRPGAGPALPRGRPLAHGSRSHPGAAGGIFSPCRSIGQKALGNLRHPMLQGRRLGNRRRLWRGAGLDAALEKRQVKRAYKLYAPAYDFVFDWIFHPGREAAIRSARHQAGGQRPRGRASARG